MASTRTNSDLFKKWGQRMAITQPRKQPKGPSWWLGLDRDTFKAQIESRESERMKNSQVVVPGQGRVIGTTWGRLP